MARRAIFGSPRNTAGRSTDNVYYIDGINITDNLTGTFGANFNSEIIQEQQIITGGVNAEYEGGQGLISRVITKSGSNEFHGSVNYYTQSDSLVADNKNLPDSTFSTFDTAFTLGGPIIRDELWFFGSLQRKEREEDIIDPVTDTLLRTVNTTEDLGFFKLTWQATENDQVVAEFFNDPYDRDGSDNITTVSIRDTSRTQGGDNYKFSRSHSWENLIATLDYTTHEGQVSSAAAVKDSSRNNVAYSGVPGVTNADTQLGGYGQDTIDFRNKDAVSLTLQYFLETDGIEVGAVYAWNSGTLYSETFAQYGRHTPVRVGDAYDFGGYVTNWLAPGTVGSQSTPSYGTLDVRAKYTLNICDRYEAEFFLDIFNVLDDQSVTREQDLSGGDGVYNFGQPNAWVTPRRFYLGARFSF